MPEPRGIPTPYRNTSQDATAGEPPEIPSFAPKTGRPQNLQPSTALLPAPRASLLADRQRIVELFPTAHRRALVMRNGQRIVEIGGGSDASSRVEVPARAAPPVRRKGPGTGARGPAHTRNSRWNRGALCLPWGAPDPRSEPPVVRE